LFGLSRWTFIDSLLVETTQTKQTRKTRQTSLTGHHP
jgi:hypothetical protein